jgi:hypothetical protein
LYRGSSQKLETVFLGENLSTKPRTLNILFLKYRRKAMQLNEKNYWVVDIAEEVLVMPRKAVLMIPRCLNKFKV